MARLKQVWGLLAVPATRKRNKKRKRKRKKHAALTAACRKRACSYPSNPKCQHACSTMPGFTLLGTESRMVQLRKHENHIKKRATKNVWRKEVSAAHASRADISQHSQPAEKYSDTLRLNSSVLSYVRRVKMPTNKHSIMFPSGKL